MDQMENDLFKQAIVEALSKNNEAELAECTDPIICSKKHYRKMSAILGFRVRRPIVWTRTRKIWVAAIVAAALLLTGCAVACHEAIGNFIIRFYENYIMVTDNDENISNPVDFEIYELTYVPEGYQLADKTIGETICHYEWSSASGEIWFDQSRRGSVIHGIDDDAEVIGLEDNRILVNFAGDGVCYIWSTEQYVFTLRFDCDLGMAEMQKIIEGVSLASAN